VINDTDGPHWSPWEGWQHEDDAVQALWEELDRCEAS
jgi:hypothetical protein